MKTLTHTKAVRKKDNVELEICIKNKRVFVISPINDEGASQLLDTIPADKKIVVDFFNGPATFVLKTGFGTVNALFNTVKKHGRELVVFESDDEHLSEMWNSELGTSFEVVNSSTDRMWCAYRYTISLLNKIDVFFLIGEEKSELVITVLAKDIDQASSIAMSHLKKTKGIDRIPDFYITTEVDIKGEKGVVSSKIKD